jgi:hypothetical protein
MYIQVTPISCNSVDIQVIQLGLFAVLFSVDIKIAGTIALSNIFVK